MPRISCTVVLGLLTVCVLAYGLDSNPNEEDNIDWDKVHTLLTKLSLAIKREKEAEEMEQLRQNSISDNNRMGQSLNNEDDASERLQKGYLFDEPAKRQNPLTGDLFTEFGRRSKPIPIQAYRNALLKEPGKRQNPLTGDLFTEFGKRGNKVPITQNNNNRPSPLSTDVLMKALKRQNPLTGDLFTEFGKRGDTSKSESSIDFNSREHLNQDDFYTVEDKRQNPLTGDLFTEFGKRGQQDTDTLSDDIVGDAEKRQNPLTGDLFTEFGKRQNPLTGDLFTEFGKRQNPLTGDLFTEFGRSIQADDATMKRQRELAALYVPADENTKSGRR